MNQTKYISFPNSGDFLNWWFQKPRLSGQAERLFNRYYVNYIRGFNGYLNHAWTDRHKELEEELDLLKVNPSLRVLDLGCGTGSISLYIACVLKGKGRVLGADINKERLFCAIERQKVLEEEIGIRLNCEFRESSIASLSSEENFDLIYLEEAFHHMEPRTEIVERISGLLKNSGVLIISEANAYNPFMQLHLLKRRGFKTIETRIDEYGRRYQYGLERILSPRKILSLFGKHDLKLKSLRYFRVASSGLAKKIGCRGSNLPALERVLLKIPFLSRIIAIHYNIVLRKVCIKIEKC